MNREKTVAVLNELIDFLRAHAENEMTSVLEALRQRLSDPHANELTSVERQGLFGGMGSLTDLYLSRGNGHTVEDEQAANAKLDKLRSRLRISIDS